jgi:beta-phosphoglucomutase
LNESAILPGALATIAALKKIGVQTAVGSASRNTPLILRQLHMDGLFDAVSDGNGLLHGKPDPEVFLRAAQMLSVQPADCLVVEDADAGLEAAKRGNMRSLGVGAAQSDKKATINAPTLADIDLAALIQADLI